MCGIQWVLCTAWWYEWCNMFHLSNCIQVMCASSVAAFLAFPLNLRTFPSSSLHSPPLLSLHTPSFHSTPPLPSSGIIQYGDLEFFLNELRLGQYIHPLREQGTTFVELLSVTDEGLIKVCVWGGGGGRSCVCIAIGCGGVCSWGLYIFC